MKTNITLAALAAALLLSACGGGGDSSSAELAPPAATLADTAGVWAGTATQGAATVTLSLLTLADGTYWATTATPAGVTSISQGTASYVGGVYKGSGKNWAWGASAATDITLDAALIPKATVKGSVNGGGSATTITGTYEATSSTSKALLSGAAGSKAGTWATNGDSGGVALTTDAAGGATGITSRGCKFTAKFTESGGAHLLMTMTTEAATCGTASSASGIAIPDAAGAMIFGLVTADRMNAVYGKVSK